MLHFFVDNWWTHVVRGVIAIVFGALAFAMPALTFAVFIYVFAAFAVVDGAIAVFIALRGAHEHERWWPMLVVGLVSIGAGILAFFLPAAAFIAVVAMFAAWVTAVGATEIVAAFQMRKEIRGEWLLAVSGILGILLGLAIIVWPGLGALVLTWCVGAYAIAGGIVRIAVGVRLHSLAVAFRSPQPA